jgi:DNA-binding transcriptional MerR regulator
MLRNWEANGLLRVLRDPATGYRCYGPREIARLRIIRMLLVSGYSTMAILRMLLYFDAGHAADARTLLDTPPPDEDIVYVSDRWLTTLRSHEERARRLLAMLEARLQALS